jgi:lysophospholipase L1-like esterase
MAQWADRPSISHNTSDLAAVNGHLSSSIVIILSILFTLTSAELWLRWFPDSDNMGTTLSAQAWMRKCWRTGPDGYREQPRPNGGSTVIVLGDSFAAGYGLCDPGARFGNHLAAQLGARASVYVVAENGADTRREWDLLQSFSHRPDVLVLSYLGNDIDGVAARQGLRPSDLPPPGAIVREAIERSYLVSLIYWRNRNMSGYMEYYRRAWASPDVVREHLQDLDRFFSLGIPTVVVIWPIAVDPRVSSSYEDMVTERVRAQGGIPVRVSDLIADLPVSRQVVSSHDAHPSAEVHRRVGEALRKAIEPLVSVASHAS